ncbi:hypothetical protein ACVWW4_000407 [Bradyrhizobium sp. LB7.1]
MADTISSANRIARHPQGRITAATAIGVNALKPIMHFQVSMLRMWADSIERLAGISSDRAACLERVNRATSGGTYTAGPSFGRSGRVYARR